jgi:hypothetical protein
LLVSKSRPQFADSNAEEMLRIFQGAVISNPGPDMVKAKPTMHHHHDCGSDNDFDDPASWNRASYNHHSCDDLESSPDVSNPYRAAAIFHLQLMFAVDEFLTDAPDARVAVVAVAVVLSWPSTRGLTVGNIATRLACTRPARRLNRRRLIRHPEHEMPVHHLLERILDEYIVAAGLQSGQPLFQSLNSVGTAVTGRALNRYNAWAAIRKRAKAAGFLTPVGCHTWRATGITIYLENDGRLEHAQQMAGHESPRTTKLYDRTKDEITLSEVERIRL